MEALIPQDWKSKKLQDVCRMYSGTTPSRSDAKNFSGKNVWVSSGELKEKYIHSSKELISDEAILNTALSVLQPGTVIIAIYGLEASGIRGTASITAIPCTISQACMAFYDFKSSVYNEYFYYWYIFNGPIIGRRYAQGTKQQNLNSEILSSFPICLPPIAEQRKIAEILSAQDRIIELKTKLLEEKKRLKKYLCQVLISGESQSEGKKILFKELFEFLNNNSCSKAQMKEKGTIYNVHYGDILTKYGELLDVKKDEVPCICVNINLSKYDRLQNGDIVFADTAEDLLVGKSTELKNVGNKHIIAGLHTIAARPIKDCFIPGWLGYYTNSPSYRRQLYTCAQGSKVISILRKDIIDTIVDVPDKTIQKKVVTVLDIISDEIKKIRIVIEQEKLKKKALMQQLLTGKVRVSV